MCSVLSSSRRSPRFRYTPSRPLRAPAPAKPADAEPIETLSPFVVQTSRDTGYQATSTLAGTRLNTPVKDLAASISIYTKDFIDDVGATSSSDLLIFATGMEAAGAGGNFSGANNDINEPRPNGNSARIDPQGTSRSRGLAAPTFTRGYFATWIPFDSYNTGAVTVNRGPNAALFGVGSAAGVVDTALIEPEFRGNRHSVALRYGNNDSLRATTDLNLVLLPQKAAFRLASLREREEFNQRPAFEDKRRVYGALTIRPTRTTTLRANFETGRTHANRPIAFTALQQRARRLVCRRPAELRLALLRRPRPQSQHRESRHRHRGLPPAATRSRSGRHASTIIPPTPGRRSASCPRTAGDDRQRRQRRQVAGLPPGRQPQPDQRLDPVSSHAECLRLPAGYWTAANVPRGQLPGFVPAGIKAQGFTDFSAFDWKNRMIDEIVAAGRRFHAFNVPLEQNFWQNHAGIELAYDEQRIDRRSRNSFFSINNAESHLRRYVGHAAQRPAQPEPRPALCRLRPRQLARSFRAAPRGARHRLPALRLQGPASRAGRAGSAATRSPASTRRAASISSTSGRSRSALGEALDATSTGDLGINTRRPGILVYMGPSVIGNNNPLRLQPIQIPRDPGRPDDPT